MGEKNAFELNTSSENGEDANKDSCELCVLDVC